MSTVEGLLQHVNLATDKINPLFPLFQSVIPSFFQLARFFLILFLYL